MAICTIFSIAFFNVFGVSLTKYASAAQRATVDTTRTVVIWVFEVLIGMEHITMPYFLIQLAGFLFLIVGTVIYNEIWIVPCECMNYYTKIKMQEREKAGMLDGTGNVRRSMAKEMGYTEDTNYMASSPTGYKYDSTRNLRNLEKRQNARSSMQGDREKLIKGHDENFHMQV